MSSNEHSTFKIAFNLAAACFISGIVIGSVYFVTAFFISGTETGAGAGPVICSADSGSSYRSALHCS